MANHKFQLDRAGAQCFGPVIPPLTSIVQQSVSLPAARLPEFVVSFQDELCLKNPGKR